ncbi:MAG: PAS domain-containing protein [Chloroflexota bacterium]
MSTDDARSRRSDPAGAEPAVRAGDLGAAGASAGLMVGADGIVRTADPAAAALLGRTTETLTGRPLVAVGGPGMAGRIARLLAAAGDEARPAPVDLEIRGAAGPPRSVRLTARATGDADGTPAVAVRDVTPEKVAGARARTADPILREAVEAYPDAVAILRPIAGPDGRLDDAELLYANAFARDRYLGGRDLAAATGLRLFGTLPGLRGILVRAFAQVHRTGRPIRRQVRLQGDRDDAIPELTIAPVAAGLLVVGRVNAQEVRSRAALREARDAYRRLAENASDLVTEIGPDGTLAWAMPSAAPALGMAPGALAGIALAALVHPEDRPALADGAVTGGALRHAEVRLRAPGAAWRWYRAAIRPRRDAAGAGDGATIGWQDVDAEVRARCGVRQRGAPPPAHGRTPGPGRHLAPGA